MIDNQCMKNAKLIILIIILIILAIVTIRFSTPEDTWLCQNGEWIRHGNPTQSKPTTGCGNITPIGNTPVACTMDAKMCPDGSYVGRIGPNCEFAKCPNVNALMELILYVQDKEIAQTSDCGAVKKTSTMVPKTTNREDLSLQILFSDELSKYGKYKSVNIENGIAKISIEPSFISLSSCESQHLTSVIRDTLTQNKNIKSVEILSPQGPIIF